MVVPRALLVMLLLVLAGCSTVAATGGESAPTSANSSQSTTTQTGGTQSGGTQSGGTQSGGSSPTATATQGAGAQAPSVHEVTHSITVEGASTGAVTTSTVTATCPAGDVALGGGWSVPAQGAHVYAAMLNGNTWAVTVSHQPVLTTLTADVECLSGVPGAVVTAVEQTPTVAPATATSPTVGYDAICQSGEPVGFAFDLGAGAANLELLAADPQNLAAALVPEVFWSFQVANHDSVAHTISLWIECFSVNAAGNISTVSQLGTTELFVGATEVLSVSCPSGTVVAGGGFSYSPGETTIGTVYLLHATPGGWQGATAIVSGLGIATVIYRPEVYAVCLTFL